MLRFEPAGERPEANYACAAALLGALVNQLGHRGRIDDGIGVGRTAEGRDTRHRRRAGLRGDRRLVFFTGLPKPGAEIDQTGAHDATARIDLALDGKPLGRIAYRDDPSRGDIEIMDSIEILGRVEDAAACDPQAHLSVSGAAPPDCPWRST